MDIIEFVNITSRAWALPILACLHDGTPGRQAKLLTATGASRTAFAQSMEHLLESGMLERNPGHGHPLRPEFRLTQHGRKAAEIASSIRAVTGKEDQKLLRRSWTLPILATVHRPIRFNQIKRTLPAITDRALSHSLKSMEERDWVLRNVDDIARPPRAHYSAVNRGALITGAIQPEIAFTGATPA